MAEQISQSRDPVEVLAEEFLERRRRGERPSLKEYTDRYPDMADDIREVFPALVVMDDIDPQSAELCRSLGGRPGTLARPPLQQLGDFRILREVGRGGMGVVYEARQEALGRRVALKVLPAAISCTELFRERFQREARAAARLHHTNIVPIFGVGEDQGVLYYAMQYIQGQGLDAVLEDVKKMRLPSATASLATDPTLSFGEAAAARGLLTGQFTTAAPVPDARMAPKPVIHADAGSETQSGLSSQPEYTYYRSLARLGMQAAEGLAHAHAQGILHRDIKPSNLLLDAQGTLWLTDFGLAKTEGAEDLTHTGEFVGTLRYMAPERFDGQGDARSDVYALGVTLYEMLTLHPPFAARDRVALMGQITNDTPPPPSQRAPHLPRDLETIVQKAMAREPAARYGAARELADDLRRFLENRPIKARRSSATERLRRWGRRNPALAVLTGALTVLLLAVAIGASITAIRLHNLNREAADNLASARHEEGEKTEKLWQSYVSEARAWRFSRRRGQRFDSLDALREATKIARERNMPAESFDRLRNEAIACLALPDMRVVKQWNGWPAGSLHVDFDSKLERYARTDRDGTCFVYRVADGVEIARLPGFSDDEVVPLVSPDGQFVAVSYGYLARRLRLWRLGEAGPILLRDESPGAAAWGFSPEGRLLGLASSDGLVRLVELPSGRVARRLKVGRSPTCLVFNARQRQFAVVSNGNLVQIVDLDSGKVLEEIPQPTSVGSLAWHPDGRTLAVPGPDNTIRLWDVPTGKPSWVLAGHTSAVTELAFNHSGDLLASTRLGWHLAALGRVYRPAGVPNSNDRRLFTLRAGRPSATRLGRQENGAVRSCLRRRLPDVGAERGKCQRQVF